MPEAEGHEEPQGCRREMVLSLKLTSHWEPCLHGPWKGVRVARSEFKPWNRIIAWIIHQFCHGIFGAGSDLVLFMGQVSCLANASTLHTTYEASSFLLLFKKRYYYNLILRGTSTPKVWLCVMQVCALFQCNFSIPVISTQYGQCDGSAY